MVGHCFFKEVEVVIWQGAQRVKQHKVGRINSSPQELDTNTWDQVISRAFGKRVRGRAQTDQSLQICPSLKYTEQQNVVISFIDKLVN